MGASAAGFSAATSAGLSLGASFLTAFCFFILAARHLSSIFREVTSRLEGCMYTSNFSPAGFSSFMPPITTPRVGSTLSTLPLVAAYSPRTTSTESPGTTRTLRMLCAFRRFLDRWEAIILLRSAKDGW